MRTDTIITYPQIKSVRPKIVWRGLWQILTLPFILFIILPILALFLRLTPTEFIQSLDKTQAFQAIKLSLSTSLITVCMALLFGTPVAYFISKRCSVYHRVIDVLIDLPTVLPPAVAGVALLMAFGRQGIVGRLLSPLGVSLPFTTAAVVLAQTFVAAPLYIKSATLGFNDIDCELKKAAALDGANRWQIFRHIMIPMARTSLISGGILTWVRALGEFGATIIFAGNFPGRTQTMPLAIYLGFEIDINVALTLSVILIAFSFLILILLKRFLHYQKDISLEDTFENSDW
ncbi:MAG: molybdate ABC transporter permease subunit [Anaerolineales bacterium]|nr:molybdate ABC transporter permease subunit [Anaerolineales bacterium]